MFKKNPFSYLILSILFDAIGMLSYLIPFFGEFSDFIWAPVSGWIMSKMYSSKQGKMAAVSQTIEELIPGLDVIPTFTLMWIYTFVLKKDD
ncbi:MAG: hypothetical protein CMC18_02525 [Flavobacteriaceae bacterium]|nr:hypothetical protein [Flavobacteriaceae bacterium]